MTDDLNRGYSIRSGRVSVDVRAEAFHVESDEAKLGAPIADAIAEAVRTGIRSVGEQSKDGKHRLFNNTGRLASGIAVERVGDSFAIVPPGDRLNPADFRSAEAYARVVDQLHTNVPATVAPLDDAAVTAAIAAALDAIVR